MKFFLRIVLHVLFGASIAGAEVATDQQRIALDYDRLEQYALRIADALEATEPIRAEQLRKAIGEARTEDLSLRFDRVVGLLERERYTAAQSDQVELAEGLEELLRLILADPREAQLEEERRRLELLRREIRTALREQQSIRARNQRGDHDGLAERQKELESKIERLQEPAKEADRLAGESGDSSPSSGEPAKSPSESEESESSQKSGISGKLQAGQQAMGRGREKMEESKEAEEDLRDAQRALEDAQRIAEERLRQLREEEKQRRLATLAERFRRMHESQVGLTEETQNQRQRIDSGEVEQTSRSAMLAASRLADRQRDVGSAADLALRLIRADGSSPVFEDALSLVAADITTATERLRQAQIDNTTIAIERGVVEGLADLIAAVDQSLDEAEKQNSPPSSGGSAPSAAVAELVSKIAQLRMTRTMQARILRQTIVWETAASAGEAAPEEVAKQLQRLAEQQMRLSRAADALAP